MTRREAQLQPESLPGFLSALGWGEEGRAAFGSHRESTVNDAFVSTIDYPPSARTLSPSGSGSWR